MLFRIFLLGALCVLAACAPPDSRVPRIDDQLAEKEAALQRRLSVENLLQRKKHLQNVAWRIRSANADLCADEILQSFGLDIVSLSEVEADWRSVWQEVAKVGEQPTVLLVAQGSPAADAGMEAGDQLLAFDKEDLPAGKKGIDAFRSHVQRIGQEAVAFMVRKNDGSVRELSLTPTPACTYQVLLLDQGEINAFADGESVFVTTGMMRFLENDNELALVIGHEMAHNTELHVQESMSDYWVGTILGVLIEGVTGLGVSNHIAQAALLRYSQEREAEADYHGVYFAARAGYDVDEAANIWRRLGAEYPEAIDLKGSVTHPSSARRFLSIEATSAEIERKKAGGEPLLPDREDPSAR